MGLLIFGTVAYDTIETPNIKSEEKILGGSASYAAISAKYFYTDVRISSVVGNDFDEKYIRLFQQKGIQVDGIEVKPDQQTFYWKGKYFDNMNDRETIEVQLNVIENYQPMLHENIKDSDFLVLGNFSPEVQLKFYHQLAEKPKIVFTDSMDLWINIERPPLLEVIKITDVLCINDSEAKLLSGESSLKKAANKILDMGCKYLIIKKGEHGAILFDREQHFACTSYLLDEVIDPTGAGDCFIGGFSASVIHSGTLNFENMKKAMVDGTIIASFCCEGLGIDRISNVSPKEFDARKELYLKSNTHGI